MVDSLCQTNAFLLHSNFLTFNLPANHNPKASKKWTYMIEQLVHRAGVHRTPRMPHDLSPWIWISKQHSHQSPCGGQAGTERRARKTGPCLSFPSSLSPSHMISSAFLPQLFVKCHLSARVCLGEDMVGKRNLDHHLQQLYPQISQMVTEALLQSPRLNFLNIHSPES